MAILNLSIFFYIPPVHGLFHHCVIVTSVCFINFFVKVISMVTAICLCTSYDLILGCATSWEYCHAYLLYIICYASFAILVDLHSQKLINIYFIGLVVTFTETHIFVHSFSISHIFISTLKFFCFSLLLLGKLFTWNLQHSEPHIQHHLYTKFDQK